jgi:hypothetical protein
VRRVALHGVVQGTGTVLPALVLFFREIAFAQQRPLVEAVAGESVDGMEKKFASH